MTFDIIVPVFQSKNILEIFVDSLLRTIQVKSNIIFINDNSPADTFQYLTQIAKQSAENYHITLLNHSCSMGCSFCINEGFSRISGDIVVTIDSDTILLDGWQEKLICAFNDSTVGCVGGVLLYPQTGGIQSCGIVFSNSTSKHLFLNSKPERLDKYSVLDVQSTVFAFCAFRSDIIHKIGFLDTDFFNGYEDIDYQIRVKRAGYKIIIHTGIKLYHWEKSSGIQRNWNRKSNIGLLWKKHSDYIKSDFWGYLHREIQEFDFTKSSYILLDCCQSRTDARIADDILKEYVHITNSVNCSGLCLEGKSVWIPEIVNNDLYRIPIPLLILCENFVQLRDNNYWYQLRKSLNQDDIIVDLFGNIMNFSELIQSFWPGSKIR